MTGNGKHSTHKHGDDWGVVYGIVLTTIYMCVCERAVFNLSVGRFILPTSLGRDDIQRRLNAAEMYMPSSDSKSLKAPSGNALA